MTSAIIGRFGLARAAHRPFVMPVRAAMSHVAAWEVALAVAILIASTYAVIRMAAGVYAGAVLPAGARFRLNDVVRRARARAATR